MKPYRKGIDLVYQFPLNVVDRRFEKVDLPMGKRYARSIFLQGLLVSRNNLKPELGKHLSVFHEKYHVLLKQQKISPIDFALTFVYNCGAADYFLFGVEKVAQIRGITHSSILDTKRFSDIAAQLPILNRKYCDPRSWTAT